MDTETPAGGTQGTEGFAPERRTSCRGTLEELDLGGLCPFKWNVGPGRPRTSPFMTMTSPSSMDVLGDSWDSFGTCGRLEKPKEG